MGYLDENYLGDTPQEPMQLPSELTEQLIANTVASPENMPTPEGWIRLPGGIIMRKNTAILLGVAIALVLVWWYQKKKKK